MQGQNRGTQTTQGSGLGKRTMPETITYSVVASIQTLWLAARAYGIGVGWVSILDPVHVTAALAVPASWNLVAYLCLGIPLRNPANLNLRRLDGNNDAMSLSSYSVGECTPR